MGNKGLPGHGIGRAGPAKGSRIWPGRALCTFLSAGLNAQNPQSQRVSKSSGPAQFQLIQDEPHEHLPSREVRHQAQTRLPALRRWPTRPMRRSALRTGGRLPASSSPPDFVYGIMITHHPHSRPGGTQASAGATWRSWEMGVAGSVWLNGEIHCAAACGAGVLPVGTE